MESSTFTYQDQDNVEIFAYKWSPGGAPKAAVQISHGLAEHAGRYEDFARFLTDAGYICYGEDHRGHGRTAVDEKGLGDLGPNGWDGVVGEMKVLTDIIKKENPGIPVFMMGHSWGSFLAQDYIEQWGEELKGVILSGTTGGEPPWLVRRFGPKMIKKELEKVGPMAPSPTLFKQVFKPYNKRFKFGPTGFEWLSRDPAVIEKYVNDPLCGWMEKAPVVLYAMLGLGLQKIREESNQQKVPKDLPIYIMYGSECPVGNRGKGPKALFEEYKTVGLRDVKIKVYQGAHHEILNETNKAEVYRDMLDWLDAHLK
jgi:alpha-beta hydrolase superfamily lysophospholipase